MAGKDKKPISKQRHVGKRVIKSTNKIVNKVTPAVTQKHNVTSRGLRSNVNTLSPLVKEEIPQDYASDITKSPKKTEKKSLLKMKKSKNLRVSPYTTRSSSPCNSLRNGKRIRDESLEVLKRKRKCVRKQVCNDNSKLLIKEEGKTIRKNPSIELNPGKISKIQLSGEKSASKSKDLGKNSENLKSVVAVVKYEEKVMEEVGNCEEKVLEEVVNNEEKIKEEVLHSEEKVLEGDISMDSLLCRLQVIQEVISEENVGGMGRLVEDENSSKEDVSIEKSSSIENVSDLKVSLCKRNNISCKEDLIFKNEVNDSCDTIFDISKCGDCLKPVIVDAKVKDGILLTDKSEDAFSEALYLSESSTSFEGSMGPFVNNRVVSKTEFEVDRCTLDVYSSILSAETSESSTLRCSSPEENLQNKFPQAEESGYEDELNNLVSSDKPKETMKELTDNVDSFIEKEVEEECEKSELVELDTISNEDIRDITKPLNDACIALQEDQKVMESSVILVEGNETIESTEELMVTDDVFDILEPDEKCDHNDSMLSPSESLQENYSEPHVVEGEISDINCNNNYPKSDKLNDCVILVKGSENCTTETVEKCGNSPESIKGSDEFSLQMSIRTSMADIVKKGIISDTEAPNTSLETPTEDEDIVEKELGLSEITSSVLAIEKSNDVQEFSEEKSSHSCQVDQEDEPDEEVHVVKEVQEMGESTIDVQSTEPSINLDQTMEEKRESTVSASICTDETFHVNRIVTGVGTDVEKCNQKVNNNVTEILEVQNKENVSSKESSVSVVEYSAEQLAIKETILNALGLQSSRAASLAKSTVKQGLPPIPSRTSGTLKTIIKVPRMADKRRGRNSLKLVLKSDKANLEKEKLVNDKKCLTEGEECMQRDSGSFSPGQQTTQDPLTYRIFNESCMSTMEPWGAHLSKQKSKSHGNSRKFSSNDPMHHLDLNRLHYSRSSFNGINACSSTDCQSKSSQDLDQNIASDGSSNSGRSSLQGSSEGGEASLVIPEKSASFSIHPERLCQDVCCYCFGKFGSLDTPMHLAQLKGEDKRRAALTLEAHLSLDSCLCDACYRYLDRKASCPSYQPYRRQSGVSGGILTKPQVCCVRGCSLPAHHLVRRKWLTRLKRTISKLLPLELTPVPPHQQQPLHAPLCSRHFYCLEYYSLCGICKRKLSRNNMHPVGREVHALNSVLLDDSIPVTLTGKIFLCKMCRYYSGIRLKYRDKSKLSSGHKTFFDTYRKRIWHYLGIQTLDSSEISVPMEIPKKKKKSKLNEVDSSRTSEQGKQLKIAEGTSTQPIEISSESSSETSTYKSSSTTIPTKIRFKLGNVSIEQLGNADLDKKDSKIQVSQTVAQSGVQKKSEPSKPKKKSTANSASKVTGFPGVEQLGLNASFLFHGNSDEKNKEWEKCTTTIQFDSKTKKLWQNLYYPYGNFSSFIRHLVIMEKNWRNGDLILAPNASPQAVNYVNSVQNRIAAYEGVSSWSSKSTSTKPSPSNPKPSPSYPKSSMQVPVPHTITKETPTLTSPTLSRINLTNAQISRCSTDVSTPITTQFIPVNATANFLPINCVPNQFISIGSTSSFIQIGGNTGLVHQINSAYPCVQFNQEIVPEKALTEKNEISEHDSSAVSAQASSTSSNTFDFHISNVRSLADDVGNGNGWEQQPEKQVLPNKNAIASNTYDSDKLEEKETETISVVTAPLAVTSTPLVENSDNHTFSEKTVEDESKREESTKSPGNLFKTV